MGQGVKRQGHKAEDPFFLSIGRRGGACELPEDTIIVLDSLEIAVNIWRKRKNPYLCDNNESRQYCLRKLKGIQPPILNTFCF